MMVPVDRSRDDIDHGRSGDKVSFPDPAAAPLGTDDEAAGQPPVADAAPKIDVDRPNDTSERLRADWEDPKRDWWNGPLWILLAVLVVAGLGFAVL